ncbi:MAG: pyridoxine 5'-phosphate synthase [Syntrophorhabdaceae bacterium]|nr:pyridoxine 5'-phosphate synthase [Syntrophorhabdaceae bacterium]
MPMGGVYAGRTLLCVNLDHVAQLREMRGGDEFDPAVYAAICDKRGCNGVSAHLRRDRHYIQDRDVFAIKDTIEGKFDLEIGLFDDMIDFARKVKPDLVTIVPELKQEMTAGGGLDIGANILKIGDTVKLFHDEGMRISFFIEPDIEMVEYSKECAADLVEICTAKYCNAGENAGIDKQIRRICKAAEHAAKIRLKVTAGWGLNYTNVEPLLDAAGLKEVNIGRSIISRSAAVGVPLAVEEMLEILE